MALLLQRMAAGRAALPVTQAVVVPTATPQTMTIILAVAAAVTAVAAAGAAIVGTQLLA
jgi:hypothetical protein